MWLAAIALVAKVPTRLASPALPARAARLARRIAAAPEPRANRGPEPRTVTPSPPRAGAPLLDDDAPRLGRPPATPESPSNERPMKGLPQETPHRGDGPAPRSEGALTASAPKATPPAQQEAPAAIPGEHPPETPEQGSPQGEPPRPRNAQPAAWPDHPLPTALGGLLFLLPVLSRIGIAERLDRTPELHDLALAARFLVHVGERLGEAPDDPMLTALRPAGDLGGDDLGPVLHELLVSARRWCRRRARLGLRTLVCRPGHVVATATHVDVIFDLAGADIRVRRAALDVDPGWVPWLGRVVSFHYQRGWRDG
jgi:hypothetical protein